MTDIDRYLEFKSSWGRYVDNHDGTYYTARPRIKFTGDFSGTRFVISNINIDRRYDEDGHYLDTEANPGTPYAPQYPGSPATKKYVDDNIPTNVSDLTNDSNFQTATQVSQAISTAVSSAYKYKGSVASYSNLPASGNTEGDVWNVTDTGMNYAWTGSAWDALGATVDLSNYIAKNNTTAFTPSGDYNPSTKKYVDDTVASAKSSGATAPSNPTEGQLWYDTTNDVLKVYDGTNWNVVGDDTADINTKTFYLSSTSDLTNAQAIYEWYKSGKNAIVIYVPDISEGNKISGIYVPADNSGSIANVLTLVSTRDGREQGVASFNEGGGLHRYSLNLNISNSAVTSISKTKKSIADFLSTTQTNGAYTPTNNYHPATKKYVDDSVSGAVSKGSTAPSSPVKGQLWYDTTNDVLKVYDGANWKIVGIINNTTGTTYTLQEEWVGEESQFNQLSNFGNIIYNVIE